MRNRLAPLFIATAIACSTVALAAPLDDAKKSIAAADKGVVASGTSLQAIVKSLSQHVATLGDVVRQLDAARERQRQTAPLIAKALEAVNADIAAAKSEAAAAQKALRDAEAALATAQREVAPKRAAIERAASAERKAFEESELFKEASTKVAAADAALEKEAARIDATLKTDPNITALADRLANTVRDLDAARSKSPSDDSAVAEASAKWIEAKNALQAAKAAKYADDARFLAAQKAATAALAERTALADAFDKSILTQPGVAEAQLAYRDAQSAVKLAEANADAARDRVERAGRWLMLQRNNADVIGRLSAAANAEFAEAQANLKRAQDAATGIARDLSAAMGKVLDIRDDLKDATAALKAAEKK